MPAVASMGPPTTSSPTPQVSNRPLPAPAISSASGKASQLRLERPAESVRGGTKPIITNAITFRGDIGSNASFSVEDQSVAAARGRILAIAHGPNALSDLAENFSTGSQSAVSSAPKRSAPPRPVRCTHAPTRWTACCPAETSSRTTASSSRTVHATCAEIVSTISAPRQTGYTARRCAPRLAADHHHRRRSPPALLTMPPPTPPSGLWAAARILPPPVATPAAGASGAASTNPVSRRRSVPRRITTPNGHPAAPAAVAPASQPRILGAWPNARWQRPPPAAAAITAARRSTAATRLRAPAPCSRAPTAPTRLGHR